MKTTRHGRDTLEEKNFYVKKKTTKKVFNVCVCSTGLLMTESHLNITTLLVMHIYTYVHCFASSLAPRLSINAGIGRLLKVPFICAQFPVRNVMDDTC